jgi:hypothetical protein
VSSRVALLVVATAAACSAAQIRPSAPQVRVEGASLELQPSGELQLRIAIGSREPRATFVLVATDWEISVDDRVLARGREARTVDSPGPEARTSDEVAARVPAGAAAKILAAREAGGAWRVDGVLHFKAGGRVVAAPFGWPPDTP